MSKKTILDVVGSIPIAEIAITTFLIVLLEAVLFYHFLISPTMDAAASTASDLAGRRAALSKHRADKLDEDGQRAKLAALEAEIGAREAALPPALHNEDISLAVGRFAQESNVKLDAVSFQERQLMDPADYIASVARGGDGASGRGAFGSDEDGAISGAEFTSNINLAAGLNAASAAMQASGGGLGAAGAPAGTQSALYDPAPEQNRILSVQGVQIAFRAEYHTAGEFIKFFEQSERKARVKSVNLTRVQEGDLKGVMNLEYAALSPDAEKLQAGLSGAGAGAGGGGKDSLFRKYAGYVEEGADPTIMLLSEDDDIDPDFYIVLKASTSNETKISYGVYPRVETELRSNANNAARVKLTINGDADRFDYIYELASYQKSDTRKLEATGGKIRLKILSCPRIGDDDNVQILLDIDNNTELPVEINVVNDDVLAPRFHEGIMKGAVSVNIK